MFSHVLHEWIQLEYCELCSSQWFRRHQACIADYFHSNPRNRLIHLVFGTADSASLLFTLFTLRYLPLPRRTQDNTPQRTKIKLLQWDVNRTSTPQPSKRTTSGVAAWNNEEKRNIWKFIINISVNPMPLHPVPVNCEFVNIKWWCKRMWFGEVMAITVTWHIQHPRE